MTKKNTVLESTYHSKERINGQYHTLHITSAEYDSGKMEGDLAPSGTIALRVTVLTHAWFGYKTPASNGITLSFNAGETVFSLQSDDATYNKLYGSMSVDGKEVGKCTFAKPHA